MKFLNAQSRKIEHINNGIGHFNFEINSEEFLSKSYPDQYKMFSEIINDIKDFDSFAQVIEIKLLETKETILDDDQISSIFSNTVAAFSNLFEKQTKQVLTPKANFLEMFPASPGSIMNATMMRVVNKPFQVIINRELIGHEDKETIKLV